MDKVTEGKRKRGPRPRHSQETTRQLLIRAVGDILQEEGWQGLGVNKIAFRAGVDKKMIYWYFESYNNLVKTYIKSRDFWEPVFQDFAGTPAVEEKDLSDFISAILQHQFRTFFSDNVMQSVIHWQISETNPMLKEISEEREHSGSKIAELTDPHFSGTSYNFRAVLALMLGGVYYLVWHARFNGTTVCGVDINKQRDRDDVIKSIGQVIDLVWEAAGKEIFKETVK